MTKNDVMMTKDAIVMTGRHHFEVTEPLALYTQEKLLRLAHHVKAIQRIHVVFEIPQKHVHQVEASVNTHLGHSVSAKADAEDMYAAVDKLSDLLDRQLIKLKEKSQS